MSYHQPVLLKETIDHLMVRPDGTYIDLTYGGGGHSAEIIKRLKKGRLIAFDQDRDAESNAVKDKRFFFIRGNFRYVKNFLRFEDVVEVDGAIADLGVSSHHFDEAGRGFSFRYNSQLDMRMNREASLTAKKILNEYREEDLRRILQTFGELRNAEQLSRAIVKAREQSPLELVADLLTTLERCLPKQNQNKYLAKVFQALRIEVNDEMNALAEMLEQVTGLLKSGARFAVITYHSLEDRLVKNLFKSGNLDGEIRQDFYGNKELMYLQVNKTVIRPDEDELKQNPRARSAKLRVGEKI
ncbi:MAG: 16S rRNA (cytosine(1402)-N(4))-methyltransferase RsmH [Bacteroidales bacterium]|nr:16S rRNA (cytosine(1402)-N(4))-methyltransferase RsmH [Bacteroidales bacterium]